MTGPGRVVCGRHTTDPGRLVLPGREAEVGLVGAGLLDVEVGCFEGVEAGLEAGGTAAPYFPPGPPAAEAVVGVRAVVARAKAANAMMDVWVFMVISCGTTSGGLARKGLLLSAL